MYDLQIYCGIFYTFHMYVLRQVFIYMSYIGDFHGFRFVRLVRRAHDVSPWLHLASSGDVIVVHVQFKRRDDVILSYFILTEFYIDVSYSKSLFHTILKYSPPFNLFI